MVVLSYDHSGARHVQAALAAGTELACTAGTGVLPLCAAVADTWGKVEGRDGQVMSRLAVSTLRPMVTAQVAAILALQGKPRWCELATATAWAAERFLQLFPRSIFVCVHRDCLDMIRASLEASPWGLHSTATIPYHLRFPGNNMAALAAYWAESTEELLAFEKNNPGVAQRVRYEDICAEPDKALSAVRIALGPDPAEARRGPALEQYALPESSAPASSRKTAEVPLEIIPAPLRERVSRLQVELGYSPLHG